MKVKLKMDPARAKALLMAHVEKAVFGAVMVCFVLLLWKSLTRRPYDKTPDELSAKAADISKKVEDSQVPSQLAGVEKIADFSQRVRISMKDIDGRDYPIAPLNRPPFEQKVRRKEPVFLAARDLMTYSGVGILASGEGVQERKGRTGAGGMQGAGDVPNGGGGPTMPGAGGGPGMPGAGGGPSMPGGGAGAGGGGPGMPGGGAAGGGGPSMPGGGAAGGGGPSMPGGGAMPGAGGKKPKGRANDKKPNERKKPSPAGESPNNDDDLEKYVLTPQSGAVYQGRHWICVTALVPFFEQSAEYRKVFQNATFKDATLDEPRYDRFEVQRALVKTPGQPVGEDDWEKLDMDAAYDDMRTWLAYPEVVDPRYIDDAVTWFLPPLVGANHEPDRVRHPRIPLIGQATTTVVGPTDSARPVDNKNARRRGAAPRGNRGDAGGPNMGGRNPGRGMDMGNVGMGNMGTGNMGNIGAGRSTGGQTRSGPKQKLVENKLFRFFDTTVEVGKTYRYRVRLELNNPNYDVASMYLDTSRHNLDKGETRETPWSEPSGDTFVPRADGLLAGEVSPATGAKESHAQVMVKSLDLEKGIAPVKVFDVRRGTLINENNVEVLVENYATAGGSKTESVDFETNAICLDMLGGEKQLGGGLAPGRVLVVEANGELAVLDQFADVATFDKEQRRKQRLQTKEPGSTPQNRVRDGGNEDRKREIFNLGDGPSDDDSKKGRKRGKR